jgi:hypothetical protein
VRLKVTVGGKDAKPGLVHLRSRQFPIVVSVRDPEGRLMSLKRDEVTVRTSEGIVASGPATEGRRAQFDLSVRHSALVYVSFGDEDTAKIQLLTPLRGWLWIAITLLLATSVAGMTIVHLAFTRLDGVLSRLGESSARVIEFVLGGLAAVIGTQVIRKTVASWDWVPLLQARHATCVMWSTLALLLLGPIRWWTYGNSTGDVLDVADVERWQLGDLRIARSDAKDDWLKAPLCERGESSSPARRERPNECRPFPTAHLHERILAGHQIACLVWWPSLGTPDVTPHPSAGCRRVALRNQAAEEIALRYPPPDGFERDQLSFGRDIRWTQAAPATGGPPPSQTIELSSDVKGKVKVDLRPAVAGSTPVERIVIDLEPGAAAVRRVDARLLGGAFVANLHDTLRDRDLGRLIFNGAELSPVVRLEIRNSTPGVAGHLDVEKGGFTLSDWSPTDDPSVVAWAIPAGLGRVLAMDLRHPPGWRQEQTWSLTVPGSIEGVTLRLSSGDRLGTATAVGDVGDSFVLVARRFEVGSRSPPEIIRTADGDGSPRAPRGKTPKHERQAWIRERREGEHDGRDRWFWTLEPPSRALAALTTYKTTLGECGDASVECKGDVCRYPRPDCFFDRFGTMLHQAPRTSCRDVGQDARHWLIQHVPECCGRVRQCD